MTSSAWAVTLLALALPWLAAILWVRLLLTTPAPGRWLIVIGYGYPFSVVGVTLLLRLMDMAGLPLNTGAPLLASAFIAAAALPVLQRQRAQPRTAAEVPTAPIGVGLPAWQIALIIVLGLWISLRLLNLALEVWSRPLFPWDAWTVWGLRARVWTELRELVPFVSPAKWLTATDASLYTTSAWAYPTTVSLAATWPALASGGWNEAAANLPWLALILALASAFVGQARRWGATWTVAVIFVWLLLSLPILNTHVALAGYADLWVAAAIGLGLMAFLQWARSGDRSQALLAILMLLIASSLKREGVIWVLLFLPALLAARVHGRWLLATLGISAALVLTLWHTGALTSPAAGIGPIVITSSRVELPWLGAFNIEHHTDWTPMLMHLFVYGNWHLLAYGIPVAVIVASVSVVVGPGDRALRAGLVWAAAVLITCYLLFFWTEAHYWVEIGTSVNRILLQFAPGLLFWMLTVWTGLLRTGGRTDGVPIAGAPHIGSVRRDEVQRRRTKRSRTAAFVLPAHARGAAELLDQGLGGRPGHARAQR